MNKAAIAKAQEIARKILATLEISQTAFNAIAAQLIQEKGWPYWSDYPNVADFNFGNVQADVNGHPLPEITSQAAGIVAYCFVLLVTNPSGYANYFKALESGEADAAVQALAVSPWASPPYGKDLLALYDEMLGIVAAPEVKSYQTYTVKAGDNLWAIASQHGVTVQDLLRINPSIRNPNLIDVGQIINI